MFIKSMQIIIPKFKRNQAPKIAEKGQQSFPLSFFLHHRNRFSIPSHSIIDKGRQAGHRTPAARQAQSIYCLLYHQAQKESFSLSEIQPNSSVRPFHFK
jgi:hypothetical protein